MCRPNDPAVDFLILRNRSRLPRRTETIGLLLADRFSETKSTWEVGPSLLLAMSGIETDSVVKTVIEALPPHV